MEVGVRREGTVSWFNEQKGFGFILADDGSDVFVNYSEVIRDGFQTLDAGERVSFDIVDEKIGPKAVDVRLMHAASQSLHF
nr:cold-shock protein [Pseudodesulfovibrio piezophilus]